MAVSGGNGAARRAKGSAADRGLVWYRSRKLAAVSGIGGPVLNVEHAVIDGVCLPSLSGLKSTASNESTRFPEKPIPRHVETVSLSISRMTTEPNAALDRVAQTISAYSRPDAEYVRILSFFGRATGGGQSPTEQMPASVSRHVEGVS